jgi:hypothetical protein
MHMGRRKHIHVHPNFSPTCCFFRSRVTDLCSPVSVGGGGARMFVHQAAASMYTGAAAGRVTWGFLHSFDVCSMRRRSSPRGPSQLVFLLVVTLVALCVPWLTKSEPLPSGSPSEQLSSLNILPSLSPEPSPGPEPSPIQSPSPTPHVPPNVEPSPIVTAPLDDSTLTGLLHTDKFIYMINQRGKMYRCGPTPSLGDCTLFNKLSYNTFWREEPNGGGPMAALNSSHIIATSANHMV